ncbi:Myb DNA-bind 5 domain-containing protein [Aphis craccivora]|uniref:Myb DNA-bind 5 domain-containing protein n=1 Tax=Aphis craccivora TaxID=307492 RepID=A0A6G0ZFF3_APHCR|nr:Myb DNA-bind 5 domain-containing protein [Aphis craccivora]
MKRLEHLKKGGGINSSLALNEVEEKMKDMMQLSVEGMPSHFDCDIEFDFMSSVQDVANEVYDNFAMIEDDDFVTGKIMLHTIVTI